MNLKYFLKKNINLKNSYIIVMIIGVIAIIGGYFSYALFTSSLEAKGSLNIITGNLYSKIESIDLDKDNEVVIAPNQTKILEINIVNNNDVDSKFNLYYSTNKANPNITIGYLKESEVEPATEGFVIESNNSKKIRVLITNNDSENIIITFGSDAGLSNANLTFPANKSSLNLIENSNVVAVYTYNEDSTAANYCIIGEEATCQVNTCVSNSTECPQGTIIKYKVNDNEEKYFYVLHDDGQTMTLQQRENTVYNTEWISALDYSGSTTYANDKGPLTILTALESATAGWSNVNDQTYTIGDDTTTLGFSGCSSDITCSANTYTLASRTAKSRMITLQEATALGCTYLSCPKWMYNYLSSSTSNGGTVNDTSHGPNSTSNDGYWTMSAESYYTYVAWVVTPYGLDYYPGFCDSTRHGARAVIEIFK